LLLILPKVTLLLSGTRTEIAQLRARIASDRTYSAELDKQVKDFLTLNTGKKTKVNRAMPLSLEAPELFVMFDAMAQENGLVLESIDTATDLEGATADGVIPVRVSLNVTGGAYPAFRGFLYDVEQNERISDVESVLFVPDAGSYGVILHTYYVDPHYTPPVKKDGAKP
jgi:Tfp pilus assembly protein PilO